MSTPLLPLRFGLTPRPSPYTHTGVFGDEYRPVSQAARAAVLRRDFETCRFCGFHSAKFQTAVCVAGSQRDIDDAVTSCVFCEQVLRLDLARPQKSGVLVWLPHVSQAALNRAMYVVYLLRISQGERAERARRVLDLVMACRSLARERFGSDNSDAAVARLRGDVEPEPGVSTDPNDAAALGLRLLPLDRRILREAGIEYNQFPQILAHMRSKRGPLGAPSAQDQETFDAFERSLLSSEAGGRG